MTEQQVIELVEKSLADKSSVTTDELKQAYAAAPAAYIGTVSDAAHMAAADVYASAIRPYKRVKN